MYLHAFLTACGDINPVIRYWGAMGCLILQHKAAPALTELKDLLEDEWPVIRVVAAEALACLGEAVPALNALEPIIESDMEFDTLAALNALDFMVQAGNVTPEQVQKLLPETGTTENVRKMIAYLQAMV
jgi:hypothetical protein